MDCGPPSTRRCSGLTSFVFHLRKLRDERSAAVGGANGSQALDSAAKGSGAADSEALGFGSVRCGGGGESDCRRRPVASIGVAIIGRERRPAATLWVDPKVHAAEYARFSTYVVAGKREEGCSIWTAASAPKGTAVPSGNGLYDNAFRSMQDVNLDER